MTAECGECGNHVKYKFRFFCVSHSEIFHHSHNNLNVFSNSDSYLIFVALNCCFHGIFLHFNFFRASITQFSHQRTIFSHFRRGKTPPARSLHIYLFVNLSRVFPNISPAFCCASFIFFIPDELFRAESTKGINAHVSSFTFTRREEENREKERKKKFNNSFVFFIHYSRILAPRK